ncbi:MAG: flagellar M-ring protein FliF, partial [Pseudooceanicola sp.]|nr:flagellar M-ring protein FliF [Pseudooceanicola sp.]
FGTTSQMFDAAYWRAKEGELARTILASPFVSQARVHIANTGSNPFQRTIEPSASVSIVPAGVPITAAQANALRFLVASAVAGLSVDKVAIIDANGTLLGPKDDPADAGTADDRALLLRDRVQHLVEARVGPGNAVVEVSVDTVTETESIRERRFDPESRVAISTETEERSDSSKGQAGGDVTVASNLPDGNGAQGGGSSAQASETRERVNYEVSETSREITRAPGAVKRLSVAVLVNGIVTPDASGAPVYADRSPEELASLRELVASAVGFQEDRGDVITIKSMELPTSEPAGTAAGGSFIDGLNIDAMSLIQMTILATVALVLGLFVVRPLLAGPAGAPAPAPPGLPALPPLPQIPPMGMAPALNGEIDDGGFAPLPALGAPGAGFGTPAGLPGGGENADPVERLRAMIGERQTETVEILRGWLEESSEPAT